MIVSLGVEIINLRVCFMNVWVENVLLRVVLEDVRQEALSAKSEFNRELVETIDAIARRALGAKEGT